MPSKLKYKIIMMGNAGCGKTTLFKGICTRDFNAAVSSSVGVEVFVKNAVINSQDADIELWDTWGEERFKSVAKQYYRSADCAILCLNPFDTESWKDLKYWTTQLNENNPDCKIFLCSTMMDKSDVPVVDTDEVRQLARNINATFHRVSGKTGEGVVQLYDTIISDFSQNVKLSQVKKQQQQESETNINVNASMKDSNLTATTSCCNFGW